ncbi:MAG: hypothetical protein P4N60_00425 [Verrucomicrobiae bacterium]|nr:hypothetical protein [Verrucomicrobiae bacterium]
MIFDFLLPKLKERFPKQGFRVETSPEARVIFPGVHPEVGDIGIHDDGDELTVYAGNFTHGHFSNYDENLSEAQKAEQIAEDVVAFLKSVFADEIIFWGSHMGGGGWRQRSKPNPFWSKLILGKPKKEYVWSGPLP